MKRPSLALTRPLLAWLRSDPHWAAQPLGLRALLAWRARLGSLNLALSDAQPACTVPLQPLFIAGPWRSGSTVMHELLHAALGWPTPLTWQCMDATAFALQRAPCHAASVPRPMDGLQLGALSPQEDEFALLACGVDSAYRAFWQPQRLGELHATLDAAHWERDLGWLARWERFVRTVLGPQDRQGRVLLKSPNHSFRWPVLQAHFAQARVVWMLRDGRAVLQSNRKMWSQMAATHGLAPLDAPALDAFLCAMLWRAAERLDALGPADAAEAAGRRVCVWQEALLADPRRELARALATLGLDGDLRSAAFEQALARTAQGRVERYAARPEGPALEAALAAFDAAQRRAYPPTD